jgi:NADH-quinone oxidoreductase subunit D/NADH-quinone oxidoreductase subunit C/D
MESQEKSIIPEEQQEYVINMGPQHPSTHGVLRLVVALKGETVTNVEPHIGYIHSGIEKMCESLTYPQIIHLTDRMDYLSAHINNEAVCLNVEKALQAAARARFSFPIRDRSFPSVRLSGRGLHFPQWHVLH